MTTAGKSPPGKSRNNLDWGYLGGNEQGKVFGRLGKEQKKLLENNGTKFIFSKNWWA